MLKRFSYLFFLFYLSLIFPIKSEQHQSNIKAIIFDFGGVIATTNQEEVTNFIADTLDMTIDESIECLKQLKERVNAGEDEGIFWKLYAESRGKKLPDHWLEELNIVRFKALKEIPGMVALVKDLQRQGFPTALLSNVRKSQAKIKSQLGHYELFHPICLSCDTGLKKPDPKAYYYVLDQLQMLPEDVLFIDNKPLNIEAAQALGLDAIQFIDTLQLIEALKERGIKISVPYRHYNCKRINPS